jgi:hypothetical protein
MLQEDSKQHKTQTDFSQIAFDGADLIGPSSVVGNSNSCTDSGQAKGSEGSAMFVRAGYISVHK